MLGVRECGNWALILIPVNACRPRPPPHEQRPRRSLGIWQNSGRRCIRQRIPIEWTADRQPRHTLRAALHHHADPLGSLFCDSRIFL